MIPQETLHNYSLFNFLRRKVRVYHNVNREPNAFASAGYV